MLIINNLVKKYRSVDVINIPLLEIKAGECIGVVGNNGAGKSTLFRLVLDLIIPTEGEVLSKGGNVRDNEAWKDYTGSYLDENFLIDFLTPEEYLEFVSKLHGLVGDQFRERLNQFSLLFNDEILNKRKYIRELSKGNQNKVGIVSAILNFPELLILDEPFANLDPTTQIRLKDILSQYKEKHDMTILISSHDLNHVTDICDRIIILEKGKIVKDFQKSESTLKELENYFAS